MKLRVIFEKPWSYSICDTDRTERPVIVVLSGGTAMHYIVVELSEDELSRFREYEHALDDLARAIQYSPSSYAGRMLEQSGNEPLEFVDNF